MTLDAVIIVGLAAWRATRLVTTDDITEPLRDAVLAWAWDDPDAPNPSPKAGNWRTYVSTLITCPHCVSVYAAAGALAWWWWWPWARWAVYLAAVAGFASIVASVVGKLED